MRLDSHVHVCGASTIEQLARVVKARGMTHYMGIISTGLLHLAERLDEAGAVGIPFHWLNVSEGEVSSDVPVAGYKIHPRQERPADGSLFLATAENLGPICERAGRERRPILFHTDGDDPNPASVPMLAELALAYPDTTIIAGHSGVYTQECFIVQYSARTFEPMMEPLWRQNLRLFIEVPNLYGDTTKFGMDFTWRSSDPMYRLKAFKRAVESFSRAERKALIDKLFIGTDFPHFNDHVFDPEQSACLRGTDYVEKSHLGFQYECMHQVFGDLLDEDRMVENFYSLLPDAFARTFRSA